METVSITIPCRNEENYIGRCLQSIVDSDFPKDRLKVFVADGLSNDQTADIILEYAAKHSFIHYLKNEKQTTPFALNLGLKASDADVKIILGAHSEVLPDFISENVRVLKEHPEVGCAGGVIENVIEDDTSAAIALAMSSPFGVGSAHFRTGAREGYVDTVAFGAYRKEVFEKIGYFDEQLTRNQDDEFNFRVIKAGFKIWLASSIRSRYFVRASFKKLWRQYYQYGYWKVFINRKHGTITTIRQLIPALMVAGIFFGFLLSLFFPVLWWPFTFVVLLYLLGALAAAVRISKNSGQWMPVLRAFLNLHFSYGIGYLEGIIHFLILNKQPAHGKSTLSR